MRAARLGLSDAPVKLAAATGVRDILTSLGSMDAPGLLVIDSIQTMHSDTIEGAPGTVSQVRGCAFELIRYAKENGVALVLVGHVTKDGSIAGPRVLEHMVDVVMSFEGERSHQYRILRALKNRFGAVDEIGVFAMAGEGLEEVDNPSMLFLSGRDEPMAGSAVSSPASTNASTSCGKACPTVGPAIHARSPGRTCSAHPAAWPWPCRTKSRSTSSGVTRRGV
jgi:DNA repair protein RadA/Sms